MGKKPGSPNDGDTKTAELRAEHDAQPEPQAPTLRSVDEWRDQLFPPSRRGPHPELYQHVVADARHGWRLHAHHMGAPMRLSESDYRSALEAALRTKADELAGRPRVHAPALFQLKQGSGDD